MHVTISGLVFVLAYGGDFVGWTNVGLKFKNT